MLPLILYLFYYRQLRELIKICIDFVLKDACEYKEEFVSANRIAEEQPLIYSPFKGLVDKINNQNQEIKLTEDE